MSVRAHGGIWRVAGPARWGRQHQGHAPGGPQDRFSAAWANAAVGNPIDAPLVECDLLPPRLEASADCLVAVGGAPVPGPRYRPIALAAGQHLAIEPPRRGCRVYIALAGGVVADGERLHRAGLPTREPRPRPAWSTVSRTWTPDRGWYRCLPGPEFHLLQSLQWAGPWRVGRDSDGRGLRLEGAAIAAARYDIPSSPVVDGTVQLTAAGPVVLLRGRGTLGGYPRILTVIEPDVDLLAQARPGDALRFEVVDAPTARRAERAWHGAFPCSGPDAQGGSRPPIMADM